MEVTKIFLENEIKDNMYDKIIFGINIPVKNIKFKNNTKEN